MPLSCKNSNTILHGRLTADRHDDIHARTSPVGGPGATDRIMRIGYWAHHETIIGVAGVDNYYDDGEKEEEELDPYLLNSTMSGFQTLSGGSLRTLIPP
jgi:hypothetical protein